MNRSKKPLAIALGTAFALGGAAQAGSLFVATDLASGYMVASAGDTKAAEHACGEGKCGAAPAKTAAAAAGDKQSPAKAAAAGTAKTAAAAAPAKTAAEHACGEGKCGAAPKAK